MRMEEKTSFTEAAKIQGLCKKLETGMRMEDFPYRTPWKTAKSFLEESSGSLTCLMFLRYYGCSTCQLEIHEFIQNTPQLNELGVKLFVVLQSEPETLQTQADESYFPFDIICDPEQSLYQRFIIGAHANSAEKSERLLQRIAQARANGIVHGKYEGNEEQSPATILIDREGIIRYSWYGTESTDVPTGEELIALLKNTFEL